MPKKLSSYIQAGAPIFGHGPADGSSAEFLSSTNTGKLWHSSNTNDGLAVMTEKMKRTVETRQCWPSATVINNPYDDNTFRNIHTTSRKKDFAFLGRLVSDKGVDLAIKAISKLSLTHRETSFTIIGDGPDRSLLEQMVSELNLSGQIIFRGSLQGELLVDCLNEHRFQLVPSRWEEPFGIVALEGMACGCVPIVSDGGGLPEAVGEAGLTFVRGDCNSLTDCLMSVIKNPEIYDQLASKAKTHLEKYTLENITNLYIDAIKKITDK